MPGFYNCFLHPAHTTSGQAEQSLDDTCPECGRPYGFPLVSAPIDIGDYRITGSLDRGFYGVTYCAERGALRRRWVLKVVPKAVYAFFQKDFAEECRVHHEVSAGTQHLVDIVDAFDQDVDFDGTTVACHVAVLEFVEGVPLSEYLAQPEAIPASEIAQIAVDLFRLLAELERKRRYHNDLHDRNIMIQRLGPSEGRAGELAERVRVVAVDLGSIADQSASNSDVRRLGDLGSIVEHLLASRDLLLSRPDALSDLDYRLAVLLDEVAHSLQTKRAFQRPPDYASLIDQVRQGYQSITSPWVRPPALARFNEAYNAQGLHPWYVPRLLVDPDGAWEATASGKDPLVITGMRGCGKTMLLRALQFHARAWKHVGAAVEAGSSQADHLLIRLREDGYVGLYVSCTRLLDTVDGDDGPHEPYARLYIAYAREALRAVRHLREVLPDQVAPLYWSALADVVTGHLRGSDELRGAASAVALEHMLTRQLAALERGDSGHELTASPAVAFPALAEALLACAPMWSAASVLFLLDDVSTRHIAESSVADLLSTLLFTSPHCGFKFTTEAQTLETLLRSPGLIEKARPGRDYESLDLSGMVSRQMNQRGADFIESILTRRAAEFANHPDCSPSVLLGSESLEDIARAIASGKETSRTRKGVYHGMRALVAICVGDIGDVISIYDSMVSSIRSMETPIPAEVQSSCFQDYCSKRLYHLNRRGSRLKDFALSFAAASHELLMRSAADLARAEAGEIDLKRRRLRQYSQLYVRLTTGDTEWQFRVLRELMDAGVFVLEGGSDTPRTKTRDSNPIQQFILSYRKLYGLSSFIGLADADRFELSGADLEAWLNNPADGKDILTRGLGGVSTAKETATPSEAIAPKQLGLPATKPCTTTRQQGAPVDSVGWIDRRIPIVRAVSLGTDEPDEVHTLVVGLGFEERTLESARRLSGIYRPSRALAIRYDEAGFSDEIAATLVAAGARVVECHHSDGSEVECDESALTLVDATGLSKPLIFNHVRSALINHGRVLVALTDAKQYYPTNEAIENVLEHAGPDDYSVLEATASLWSGESTPYAFDPLMTSSGDPTRPRLLCAAASAKHERLLSLLEGRQYDSTSIAVPDGDSPRDRIARLAADVATKGLDAAVVEAVGSEDVKGHIQFIASQYARFYDGLGFDVELALTGSKGHGVACAVASVVLKFAQCWYVRPEIFLTERFTNGVGATRVYDISLPPSSGIDAKEI